MEFIHKSVLLSETVESLNVIPNGVYVDGTAGGGGHSSKILERLNEEGKLICIDQDPDAIEHLKAKFAGKSNVIVVKSNFADVKSAVKNLGFYKVNGVILDLGVSSYQLDTSERGFSYHQNAHLDMRMSKNGVSAYDLVNDLSKENLSKILFEYAEEKYAGLIANAIVKSRKVSPIETTIQLVDVIKSALPAKVLRKDSHPAKKTFQALRIAVNDELESLSRGLDEAFDILKIDGRLSVITFHSIEDRIVKQRMKSWSIGCTCPPDFPVCVCGNEPKAQIITKKPIIPSEYELNENNRSRSAKLRVCTRIR